MDKVLNIIDIIAALGVGFYSLGVVVILLWMFCVNMVGVKLENGIYAVNGKAYDMRKGQAGLVEVTILLVICAVITYNL